ncbi:MAG: histidine kinase [Treponema sp.]|nr:histidine kinase [Treponema sp.]
MKLKMKYIALAFQMLAVIVTFVMCSRLDFPNGVTPMRIVNVSFDILGMIVSVCIFLGECLTPKRKKADIFFGSLVFFETLTLFCDSVSWLFFGKPEYSALQILAFSLFYLSSVLCPTLCWFYQKEVMNLRDKVSEWIGRILVSILVVFSVTIVLNVFFKFYFFVDETTGEYFRGPLYEVHLMFVFTAFLIVMPCVATKKANWHIKSAFMIINVAPYIAAFIQVMVQGLSVTYIGVLVAIIIVYVNVQVTLRRKLEIIQNQVLVAQIQPHFLFNTFATIQALCRRDADLAAKTINNFSKYLRGNIRLQNMELVPFSEELNHIKVYTDIEKMRFPNISVEFELENDEVRIPFLSIEPLVENSIKHGIRGKNQGFVKIHTYFDEKNHIIEVVDNGTGFDAKKILSEIESEKSEHIGLKNVKDRIESMCNGKMKIESQIGVGTKITVRIPKKQSGFYQN